jgi:glycerophosphoryl diester phosphodiesterase/membrane-associated phospholipid phosphatase
MPSTPAGGPSRRRQRARAAALLGLLVLVVAFIAQVPPRDRVDHFLEHTPSVIAHAGAQGHAPPNTLEAFELALEQGADVLEMDTQLTADGGVVTHHDGTVDWQTDGTGAIVDMTLAELQQLDAGHGFVAEDGEDWTGRGTRIPTLEEVLEAFPDTFLIIEGKPEGGPGIVDAVADRIEAADAADRVAVASFLVDDIRAFRERLPGVATNMPEDETRAFYLRHFVGAHRWWSPPGEFFQVPEFHDGRRVVSPRFVGAAERLGVDVHVWTVNERDDMRRLLDMGVHGIMTDFPDRLVEVIEEREEQPVAQPGGWHETGLDMVRWSQDRLDVLTPLALAVTHLGDAEFYLLLFPLLYWSVSRRLGLRVGVILLLSASLNAIAKVGTATPRPFFFDADVGRVSESSFGIPSGHAQNGVAVWGLVAYELRRRWAWVAATALALALGLSRLHLGAHFPEDILLGWAVGALLLVAFIRAAGPVQDRLDALSPARALVALFVVSAAFVAAGAVVRVGVADWQVPASWVGAGEGIAEGATGLGDVVTPAAALFGLGAGVLLLRRHGGFDSGGSVAARFGRYVVGVLGVLVLWQGLGAVFPDGESVVALAARYVRYALIGFWIGGLAPIVFVRLGLASAEAPAWPTASSADATPVRDVTT